MSILVIAESNGIEVDRGTLSAITAAQKIGDKINLLILEDSEQVINKAKKIKGVTNIIKTSGKKNLLMVVFLKLYQLKIIGF